jgi:hypothetical protein
MDNIFHTRSCHINLRLNAINLTNVQVLHNFLSTFSGTHVMTSRVWEVEIGITFSGQLSAVGGQCSE